MPITFDEKKNQFHLFNSKISYIMELRENYLIHVYFGKRIQKVFHENSYPFVDRSSFSPLPSGSIGISLDSILQEIPGNDSGDFREGLIGLTYGDGTRATQLKYVSHRIFRGKDKIIGLPQTTIYNREDATSLEIKMQDSSRKLTILMSYSIFSDFSIIAKSIKIINDSENDMKLDRAYSSCIDFYDSSYEMIQLPGAWAREKQEIREKIVRGIHQIDSKRGASSVHQQPFLALVKKETTESQGEVWASHLIYSGNFVAKVEVDPFEQTRVLIGINDHNFLWNLKSGESFQTPEVVHAYSSNGLNEMSNTFHELYRNHLNKSEFDKKERPILINNWETTYFDFDEDKILDICNNAKRIGAELFVLDDGWFEKRNSDKTSLGDWIEDRRKLPGGLARLSERINELGLDFGLWFEPEMVSEQSDFFKRHSDWYIHVENYPSSKGRNQFVLDYSREDVRKAVLAQMEDILKSTSIKYIKWDMNRNITELGSKNKLLSNMMELSHKYILGLYKMLEYLTNKYPEILFENCSGGGGRFDPGMAYYMPQSWTSDNTDAVSRLKIQYGTSFVFPPIMMCAHLSESPNHQVGRKTSFDMRKNVAMSGNLGIMLNLDCKNDTELNELKESVEWYKENRSTLQFGEFYRLISPFETNYCSWMFKNKDTGDIILFVYQILNEASKPLKKVKLLHLEEKEEYSIGDNRYSGSELMEYGLFFNQDMNEDFCSKCIEIKKL